MAVPYTSDDIKFLFFININDGFACKHWQLYMQARVVTGPP